VVSGYQHVIENKNRIPHMLVAPRDAGFGEPPLRMPSADVASCSLCPLDCDGDTLADSDAHCGKRPSTLAHLQL
jgi:hypothetical protein